MIKKLLICGIIVVLLSPMISVSEVINKDESKHRIGNKLIDNIGIETNNINGKYPDDMTWYLQCDVYDNGYYCADFFIIAEDPNANDGPPADYYDAPQPPEPPAPYVYTYLNDNLKYPNDKLKADCREYPDTYKIFNLTVIHDLNGVNYTNYTLEYYWTINGSNEIEYSNIELIYTKTGDHFSLFEQYSWILPVEITGSSNYKIICDLVHIELDRNWNFISPYCNTVNDKCDSLICHENSTINWSEAVNSNVIIDSVFSWDNLNQSYMFSNTLNSGQGYWIYAHSPCYLWLKKYTIHTDNTITELQNDWNLIGSPFNTPFSKNNVTIEWNNTNYSWSDAINIGLITNVFYSWNGTIQSYEISNTFEPGKAYWLYAYQPCVLKKIS